MENTKASKVLINEFFKYCSMYTTTSKQFSEQVARFRTWKRLDIDEADWTDVNVVFSLSFIIWKEHEVYEGDYKLLKVVRYDKEPLDQSLTQPSNSPSTKPIAILGSTFGRKTPESPVKPSIWISATRSMLESTLFSRKRRGRLDAAGASTEVLQWKLNGAVISTLDAQSQYRRLPAQQLIDPRDDDTLIVESSKVSITNAIYERSRDGQRFRHA